VQSGIFFSLADWTTQISLKSLMNLTFTRKRFGTLRKHAGGAMKQCAGEISASVIRLLTSRCGRSSFTNPPLQPQSNPARAIRFMAPYIAVIERDLIAIC
jgi:hypothetical protein